MPDLDTFDLYGATDMNDNEVNPYAATTAATAAPTLPTQSYGGIGRLAYFGLSFLVGIVFNVLSVVVGGAGDAAPAIALLMFVGYLIAICWVVAQRMINMGYSAWWCLGMFVPILNLLVGLRAIACPEGYADHRTLDTAGKIIAGTILALIVLGVVAIIFAASA